MYLMFGHRRHWLLLRLLQLHLVRRGPRGHPGQILTHQQVAALRRGGRPAYALPHQHGRVRLLLPNKNRNWLRATDFLILE